MEPARDHLAARSTSSRSIGDRSDLVGDASGRMRARGGTVEQRPIRLVVRETTSGRSRLTVVFRLLLAIPLVVWVALRGIAAFVVGVRELARRAHPG